VLAAGTTIPALGGQLPHASEKVVQWFPKLGVYEPAGMRGRSTGGWNCHQFHANSEFYADFGRYTVDITAPSTFVVDPAYGAGGMGYPTSITAGTSVLFNRWPFDRVRGVEAVTIHGFGHQFWYAMVANNEFEEAWLDEGINSYSTGNVMEEVDGRERTRTFTFVRPERLEWADIDPDRKILPDVNWLNNGWRLEGDSRPAVGWATRWMFFVQTILSTLGML